MNEDLLVDVELPNRTTARAGTILLRQNRGFARPTINFEYDADYLITPGAYALSPDLPLVTGYIQTPSSRDVFTAFADAQPDAWGRRLINADTRREAREAGVRWTAPSELGVLTRVPDLTRQGALRFRADETGPYLGASTGEVPTFVDLADLVEAAARFEAGGEFDVDPGILRLIHAGSSQGGARPKATVTDGRGRLAIAKLPSTDDRADVMSWEAVALELAVRSGITTPQFELRRTSEFTAVLVVRRFDREGDAGHRVGYLSARSLMLVEDRTQEVDYTLFADHLAEQSDNPAADLEELFRRVALTVMVNNVDDHMKNHGVLRTATGWRLSPVFDVNPHPFIGQVDGTPISPEDDPYDRDIRLLVEAADRFRLTPERAAGVIREVDAAVATWPEVAASFGIPQESIDRFRVVFENTNRTRAAVLSRSSVARIDLADGPAGPEWVPPHTRNGRVVDGYFRRRTSRGASG